MQVNIDLTCHRYPAQRFLDVGWEDLHIARERACVRLIGKQRIGECFNEEGAIEALKDFRWVVQVCIRIQYPYSLGKNSMASKHT